MVRTFVVPSKTDNRISIAFNIIPKGEFGFPYTAKIIYKL
jgi:hypothetical protein